VDYSSTRVGCSWAVCSHTVNNRSAPALFGATHCSVRKIFGALPEASDLAVRTGRISGEDPINSHANAGRASLSHRQFAGYIAIRSGRLEVLAQGRTSELQAPPPTSSSAIRPSNRVSLRAKTAYCKSMF
jgi:hypothetical protein